MCWALAQAGAAVADEKVRIAADIAAVRSDVKLAEARLSEMTQANALRWKEFAQLVTQSFESPGYAAQTNQRKPGEDGVDMILTRADERLLSTIAAIDLESAILIATAVINSPLMTRDSQRAVCSSLPALTRCGLAMSVCTSTVITKPPEWRPRCRGKPWSASAQRTTWRTVRSRGSRPASFISFSPTAALDQWLRLLLKRSI